MAATLFYPKLRDSYLHAKMEVEEGICFVPALQEKAAWVHPILRDRSSRGLFVTFTLYPLIVYKHFLFVHFLHICPRPLHRNWLKFAKMMQVCLCLAYSTLQIIRSTNNRIPVGLIRQVLPSRLTS